MRLSEVMALSKEDINLQRIEKRTNKDDWTIKIK